MAGSIDYHEKFQEILNTDFLITSQCQ